MAVPKRKVSKARRDKRRSNNWKLEAPEMAKCPKCGADLNISECGCDTTEPDPRFDVLRKLLEKK